MDRPWAASDRAATWNTVAVSSPAILYMFGIMSSRPWDAVYVVLMAPPWSAPCMAPAAPASLCISMMVGTVPQMLVRRALAQSSASSAIVELGVIG